jgi:O-methyltransferase
MKLDTDYFQEKTNLLGKVARRIFRLNSSTPPDWVSTPHNKAFFNDKIFQDGYSLAVKNIGSDYRIPWRVHQAIWAAHHCLNLEGDFVELGTGKGFVMQSVLGSIENWNKFDKKAWLYDTFQKFEHSGMGKSIHNQFYADNLEEVKFNFSNWDNIIFVEGDVSKEIISNCPEKISFLHVDLNDGDTEIEILRKIINNVVSSGIIILDDYANRGEEYSYKVHTEFFNSLGYNILTTPSGQGIIIIR